MDLEIIILNEVSQTKTNIIWYHLYAESKKEIQMNLPIRNRNGLTKNQLMVTKRGRGWGILGAWDRQIHTSIYKVESWESFEQQGDQASQS